ncbi:hypothetical protein SAMD00023353_0500420 [Rosellinia necatrix]|uniref:Uncharacterized protein n=1 Tax=Rosellinia necatrix TaxID=77044 RepID=A0A1S8A628_ROSNE|nr:hypothetical protein SAMD00023353_0500420 [Rosellinia necatrix]
MRFNTDEINHRSTLALCIPPSTGSSNNILAQALRLRPGTLSGPPFAGEDHGLKRKKETS